LIDPVVINGTYTPRYDTTTLLRPLVAEPTIETMPLVNTIQRSMPIELSSGQVVALPTDLTDYRVFDEAAGETENSGAGAVAGTGAGAGNPGNPRRNDDDDDNQISTIEEYVKRFGKTMNRRTARRIRNSERISHDANGNINRHATRLLNRGVNAGAEGTKTGGFP
jgi:hypothetical protein